MTRILAAGAAVLVLFLALAGGIVVNAVLAQRAIDRSNAQWCTTLDLLTSRPVPGPADPAANPSRAGAYEFYENLLTLRQHFGCGT